MRCKRTLLELINLVTNVMFTLTLWVAASNVHGFSLGYLDSLVSTELMRPSVSSACGYHSATSLNITLQEAATHNVDYVVVALAATGALMARVLIRMLLATINLCLYYPKFPVLRSGCAGICLYSRLFVIGIIYSGLNPWAASMRVWNLFRSDDVTGNLTARRKAWREAKTMFILLLIDKLPIIAVEYYLAFTSDELVNVIASVDLAMNIISLMMLYNDFISVYEMYVEIGDEDSLGDFPDQLVPQT